MNKYQKYLIDKCEFVFSIGNTIEAQKCYNEEKIIITQAEDITLTKYYLKITGISIEKIYANKVASKAEFTIIDSPKSTPRHPLFTHKQLIDFDERIDTIEIQFKNGLAENLIIPVVYIEADKEAYYAKKQAESRANLIASAQIKHATGNDLVNIYFQPCCDAYAKTTIALYTKDQLMAKYKVDEEAFFKSITGLAYGVYFYELAQYDTDGNELFKSDKIKFLISAPQMEFEHINVI